MACPLAWGIGLRWDRRAGLPVAWTDAPESMMNRGASAGCTAAPAILLLLPAATSRVSTLTLLSSLGKG
jgi:hypothetical protein